MQARFGDDHRIHLESEGDSFSMLELYVRLFRGLEYSADLEQWRRKNVLLHGALHQKLLSAQDCSVVWVFSELVLIGGCSCVQCYFGIVFAFPLFSYVSEFCCEGRWTNK